MIGVVVSYASDDGEFDRARVGMIAEETRAMFEGMPGLRGNVVDNARS